MTGVASTTLTYCHTAAAEYAGREAQNRDVVHVLQWQDVSIHTMPGVPPNLPTTL